MGTLRRDGITQVYRNGVELVGEQIGGDVQRRNPVSAIWVPNSTGLPRPGTSPWRILRRFGAPGAMWPDRMGIVPELQCDRRFRGADRLSTRL
jgi:hypothetical protein